MRGRTDGEWTRAAAAEIYHLQAARRVLHKTRQNRGKNENLRTA